jgi:hypothetical protein
MRDALHKAFRDKQPNALLAPSCEMPSATVRRVIAIGDAASKHICSAATVRIVTRGSPLRIKALMPVCKSSARSRAGRRLVIVGTLAAIVIVRWFGALDLTHVPDALS